MRENVPSLLAGGRASQQQNNQQRLQLPFRFFSIFKRIVNEGTWTGAELISLIWNSFMFPLCVFRLCSMVARASMLCEIGEVKPWVLKWKQETRWKNRMEVENWINKHRKISTRVWDTETVKLDELNITQIHRALSLLRHGSTYCDSERLMSWDWEVRERLLNYKTRYLHLKESWMLLLLFHHSQLIYDSPKWLFIHSNSIWKKKQTKRMKRNMRNAIQFQFFELIARGKKKYVHFSLSLLHLERTETSRLSESLTTWSELSFESYARQKK